MSEERKTIYLCLAHMSEEGWGTKVCTGSIRYQLGCSNGP